MNFRSLYVLPGAVLLSTFVGCAQISASPRKLEAAIAQSPSTSLEAMTVERLGEILKDEAPKVEGEPGQWQLTIEEKPVLVIADSANNRMRIFTPIIPAAQLSTEQTQAMLLANFHSALDARYAVTNGTVVSVFVHPLSSLQEADLRSGLKQVATLATTFGTNYSSGGLGFLPNGEPQETSPLPADSVGI